MYPRFQAWKKLSRGQPMHSFEPIFWMQEWSLLCLANHEKYTAPDLLVQEAGKRVLIKEIQFRNHIHLQRAFYSLWPSENIILTWWMRMEDMKPLWTVKTAFYQIAASRGVEFVLCGTSRRIATQLISTLPLTIQLLSLHQTKTTSEKHSAISRDSKYPARITASPLQQPRIDLRRLTPHSSFAHKTYSTTTKVIDIHSPLEFHRLP